MPQLSKHTKSALYWFIDCLTKGILDDERWDFDFNRFENNELDWQRYQEVITDPSCLKAAISVWSNNLEIDDSGAVTNEDYAAFRAFQTLRPHFDPSFTHEDIQPPIKGWEWEEHESAEESAE